MTNNSLNKVERKKYMEELHNTFNDIPSVRVVKYHAGVNLGNLFTKAVGDKKGKTMFLTSAEEIGKAEAEMSKNDDTIIGVSGKYYIVGDDANSADTIDKRDKEVLTTSACYSIAKMMLADDNKKMLTKSGNFKYKAVDVQLVVGLCIDEYKKQEEKENLTKLFDNNIFEINYLGHEFLLKFTVIDVMAEGYCYYQMNYSKYEKYRRIFFLDAGSKTWDTFMIINGKVRNPISLEDSGTLYLMRDIKKKIKQDTGKSLNIEDIEVMLRDGEVAVGKETYKKENYIDLISKYADTHLKAANQSYDNEIRMANAVIVFGGGATLIEDKVKEFFEDDTNVEILDDAVFANAQAYYEASFQNEE